MQALLAAVMELVALLPPAKVDQIAAKVREAKGGGKLRDLVSTPAAKRALERVVAAWHATSLTGDVVSGVLTGAAHAHLTAQQASSVELVWTGPKSAVVPTRRTEQVLLDLIHSAHHELFLVSFVAYDIPSVVAALNDAVARGVTLRVLIEAATQNGGSLSVDYASAMRGKVPGARLFCWVDRPVPFAEGRVHAKIALADADCAFITSANLTGYALERNIEAGVLVRGTQLPSDLHEHLNALIAEKVLRPVEAG